jgi:hypothetical protein
MMWRCMAFQHRHCDGYAGRVSWRFVIAGVETELCSPPTVVMRPLRSFPLVNEAALAKDVRVTARSLVVELEDGRTVSVPLTWYPRLAHASARERHRWELIGPASAFTGPQLTKTSP